jgi:hypothetical protein
MPLNAISHALPALTRDSEDLEEFEPALGTDSQRDFDFAEKNPVRATDSVAHADLPDGACYANAIHS